MTMERGLAPCWLDPDDPYAGFPEVERALKEPDGLLAIGGDLSVPRLLEAYCHGIFPWYGPGQPILWWSPDPRLVLRPGELRISRSLARTLRKATFRVTLDTDFAAVVAGCAAPRGGDSGTWISAEMQAAYTELHRQGYAHSIECWQQERLVGGLYGVSIGRVFFGESMFTRVSDASKVALAHLARQLEHWDFPLIDCQVYTPHLERLGATTISRREFSGVLEQATTLPPPAGPWALEADLLKP